jgi:hypothetical protein
MKYLSILFVLFTTQLPAQTGPDNQISIGWAGFSFFDGMGFQTHRQPVKSLGINQLQYERRIYKNWMGKCGLNWFHKNYLWTNQYPILYRREAQFFNFQVGRRFDLRQRVQLDLFTGFGKSDENIGFASDSSSICIECYPDGAYRSGWNSFASEANMSFRFDQNFRFFISIAHQYAPDDFKSFYPLPKQWNQRNTVSLRAGASLVFSDAKVARVGKRVKNAFWKPPVKVPVEAE